MKGFFARLLKSRVGPEIEEVRAQMKEGSSRLDQVLERLREMDERGKPQPQPHPLKVVTK